MSSGLVDITVQTLMQFSGGQDWRLQLAQDRPEHLLIWTTRGQGRVHLDGRRRGLGTHNALWIPAGHLFSIELGYQGSGLVVIIPAGTPLRLPEIPRHLRILENPVQSELNAIIENTQREEKARRPLYPDALEAHGALLSVWLRRQIMQEQHVPDKRNAAARLSARYCLMISTQFRTGVPMADYAKDLGVTPTHLTRAVKSATGKTAAEILTERVLFEARTLLAGTRQPAQDIARHLGFGSAAYFTRFIQQHTGKPPSKLRG
ncbi:MAG: AraC family transcriptional regulator [Sulfitobacter sp.]